MHRSVVSTQGRITIPAELRKKLRIKPGTLLHWSEDDGRLVLLSTKRLLNEIRGFLKPAPGEPSAFDMLFEERKRERIREKT